LLQGLRGSLGGNTTSEAAQLFPNSFRHFGLMTSGGTPEPLDFFIWKVEDVGVWLEEIGLGGYKETFRQNGINGEYLDNLSTFTTEQILRFIRRCHMKWGDFITLCKELRCIKGMLALPPLKKAFCVSQILQYAFVTWM
jgi:hypothetical protein